MAQFSALGLCVRSLFYRRDLRSCTSVHRIANLYTTQYTLKDTSIHHRVPEKKYAKLILHQTLDSVARKLKTPLLKPTYLSIPEQRGSHLTWKTRLTLNWPEKSCFEATGRSKKESEELAAQKAVENLSEVGVLSREGRLLHGVASQRMRQPSNIITDVPINNGPLPLMDSTLVDTEALERIEKKFPDFKSTFLNCFVKVSAHLKDANYIVRPSFKKLPKRDGLRWQATYNIKWPELQQFSGVGYTRKEAERWSILLAIHWLLKCGYMHPLGYPILYSKDEFEEWKINRYNPIPVRLPENLKRDMESLMTDYENLKPLLIEDRLNHPIGALGKKTAIPIDEDIVENLEEERELEETIGIDETEFLNGGSSLDSGKEATMDPITGYRLINPSLEEKEERNAELHSSAQNRLTYGKGPVVPQLPIVESRNSILKLIQNNRVIVLSGDTGCGKSTQMPQYILDSFALNRNGFDCNVIVTQPRRLAAVSLAQTVAKHRGEKLGESVGYQVRLNSVLPKKRGGRILFCSTGILLRRLQANPDLMGVSHLIIDEVHERDCLTDFSLIIIKDLLQANPNIKVILMSASLNANLLSRYFDGAPLVHVAGRTFPVQKYSLPDIERELSTVIPFKGTELKPFVDQNLIVKLIRHIDRTKPTEGAILCFLPGWADIKSLYTKLKEHFPLAGGHWILPVHSRLSQTEQEKIFERPPEGIRKIVLATNIAETSLTINDVVYVIDPGVHKELRYNPRRGSSMMENQWISQANVRQRAGRAGRVQPGESYHLYPPEVFENMDVFPQAEILRTPLEKVVIDIKAYNEELRATDFLSRALEPPSEHAIRVAVKELEMIGVLDENERLTALGRRIAQFSTHPRLAKALVFATLFRCLDPIVSIVAGLSSSREGWSLESTGDNGRQAIREAKRELHPTSDHLAVAKLLSQFRSCKSRKEEEALCLQTKSNPKALHFLKGVRKLLLGHLYDADLLGDARDVDQIDHPVNQLSKHEEIVKAALLMGLCDSIVTVRRGKLIKGVFKPDEQVTSSERHGPVHVASDSVNSGEDLDTQYLIYFNGVFSSERRAFVVRDTTPVENLTTVIAAGKSLALESDRLDGENVLIIDSKPHLKFACSKEDGEFLVRFRNSLLDVCDYILLTVGLRQPNELTKRVGQYHTRQISLLAKLLDCCKVTPN